MSDAVLNCEGCTKCCMWSVVPPFRNEDELHNLPADLAKPIRDYWRNMGPGHNIPHRTPCSWLQLGQCAHFEYRPPVCREFVVQGPLCRWYISDCCEVAPEELYNGAPRTEQPSG